MFGPHYFEECEDDVISVSSTSSKEEFGEAPSRGGGNKLSPGRSPKTAEGNHLRSKNTVTHQKKMSVRHIVRAHDNEVGFTDLNYPSDSRQMSPKTPFQQFSSPEISPSHPGSASRQGITRSAVRLKSQRSLKVVEELEDMDKESVWSSETFSSASSSSSSNSSCKDVVEKKHPSHSPHKSHHSNAAAVEESGKDEGSGVVTGMTSLGGLHRFWNGNNDKSVDVTFGSGRMTRRSSFCSLLVLIPFLVLLMVGILFFWVAFSSGTAKVEELSPRAVVFLLEGFSGEIFNSMMEEENGLHLPNIRRLMTHRGGVWAACPTVSDSRCARAVSVEDVVHPPSSSSSSVLSKNENGESVSVSVSGEQVNVFSVYSATSVASILSGVPPHRHKVRNNSIAAIRQYAETSKVFPSFVKLAKDADMSVTVFGTSYLLNSLGETFSCSKPGVLDMECVTAMGEEGNTSPIPEAISLECMGSSSCNANVRRLHYPTDVKEMSNGVSDERYRQIIRDIFAASTGTITSSSTPASVLREPPSPTYATSARERHQASLFSHAERLFVPGNTTSRTSFATTAGTTSTSSTPSQLYVIHFDALAKRAESPFLPGFSYALSSAEYRAQAFLIDAVIGETLAYVQERSEKEFENWLVVGMSDHGGNGKSVNEKLQWSNATTADKDEMDSEMDSNFPFYDYVTPGYDESRLLALQRASVVPFFMGTFTANSFEKSYITLKPLERPTSQLDVFPTILRWLNVAPFDDETETAWVKQLSEGTTDVATNSLSFSSSAAAGSGSGLGSPRPVKNDDPLSEKLTWRSWYEGKVQGICSSGVSPQDCVY